MEKKVEKRGDRANSYQRGTLVAKAISANFPLEKRCQGFLSFLLFSLSLSLPLPQAPCNFHVPRQISFLFSRYRLVSELFVSRYISYIPNNNAWIEWWGEEKFRELLSRLRSPVNQLTFSVADATTTVILVISPAIGRATPGKMLLVIELNER